MPVFDRKQQSCQGDALAGRTQSSTVQHLPNIGALIIIG